MFPGLAGFGMLGLVGLIIPGLGGLVVPWLPSLGVPGLESLSLLGLEGEAAVILSISLITGWDRGRLLGFSASSPLTTALL